MANNCYNFIEINGSEEEIKAFAQLLEKNETQEDGFDIYSNLLTEFHKEEPKFLDGNAKWFDMDVDGIEGDETYIRIMGDSAWLPSLTLFTKISQRYPSFKIRYEYDEMGCDFAGWADIQNGVIEDHCFSYWKGIIETQGETNALQSFLDNELESHETEEELIDSDMFQAFSPDSQAEILKGYGEREIV